MLCSVVKRSSCFNNRSGPVNSGAACIQVVNEGNEQVWRVSGNVLTKQITGGGPPVWVLTEELTACHSKYIISLYGLQCKD